MNREKTGFINLETFKQILKSWGFDITEDMIKDLFNWVDFDRDSRISFQDLR